MGNATSAPENSSGAGGAAPGDSNATSTGKSDPLFRLPLYRGERDAFLIVGNEDEDKENNNNGGIERDETSGIAKNDNIDEVIGKVCSSPPQGTQGGVGDFPNVIGDDEDEAFLSPPQLYRNHHCDEPSFFRESTSLAPPPYNAASDITGNGSSAITASPPSIISSSNSDCSSHASYGTCVSSAEGMNSEGLTYPPQEGTAGLKLNVLPRILTQHSSTSTIAIKNQNNHQGSAFDCVKIPKSASTNNIVQNNQNYSSRPRKSNSFSLLFDTCVRSSSYDEDENPNNEYYHSNNHTDYNKSPFHQRSSSQSSVFSSTSSSGGTTGYFNSVVVVAAPPTTTTTQLKSNSSSSLNTFHAAQQYTQEELDMVDGDDPTYESDLLRIRNYHVVTTAALPWMTGTGVNPLLRAGYLVKRNDALRKQQQCVGENVIENGFVADMDGVFMDAKEFVEPVVQLTTTLSPTKVDDGTNNTPVVSPSSSSCCSLDYSCFSLSEEETCDKNASLMAGNESMIGQQQEGIVTGEVTLVVPWLVERSDRDMLYGGNVFENMEEQEVYIRRWLSDDAGMPVEAKELKILFYPARYHKYYNSIFALGDICDLIPNDAADVCILEEPEHLNWYRAPGSSSWTSKFCHCVGVIHTNYKAYARDHAPAGFLAAPLLAGVNSLVVQANCHKVVKLSGVLQEFVPGSEVVENVHGIRETFLEEGLRRANAGLNPAGEQVGVYFIGKLLWAKGFDLLLELETYFRHKTGAYFDIDIFGSGPDEEEIKRAFNGGVREEGNGGILYSFMGSSRQQQPLPVNFMGRLDHSKLAGDKYSVFVNPSLTEVLCTTTAEAIAMGKWVVIPSHPSNAFFEQFPNCLMYRSRRGFVSQLKTALENDPPPLSDELAQLLSWDAATMRVVSAAAISKRDAARSERINRAKEEKKVLKKALSGFFSNAASKEGSSSVTNNHVTTSYGSINATATKSLPVQ